MAPVKTTKKTIIKKITRRKNRLASLDPSTLRGSSIVFEGGREGGSNSQFGPYTQGLTRAYNTRDEICYRVFFLTASSEWFLRRMKIFTQLAKRPWGWAGLVF
jgi:hypothetical protein